MFPPATQKDRFTKIWSREFYNFLVKEIRQDLDLVKAPKSFTYDPVKALANTGSYASFTPVSIVTAEQVRGGYKAPIVKVGALSSGPWGVVQSKCTQRQVADIVVAGVTWCNVTINNTAHKYAGIVGSTLESQENESEAVAEIIAPVTDGPSLISFLSKSNDKRCPGRFNLKVGTYRGIAAETIVPGEVGNVIIWDCEEPEVQLRTIADNHTNCWFYLNDPIVVHLDECCTAFFTGCPGEPPEECDLSVSICIAGIHKILAPGEFFTWEIPSGGIPGSCCPIAKNRTIKITISCVEESLSAVWEYEDEDDEYNGVVDLSALFDLENNVELFEQIDIPGCILNERFANFVDECEPCFRECNECIEYTVNTGSLDTSQLISHSFTPTVFETDTVMTFNCTLRKTASGINNYSTRITLDLKSGRILSYDMGGGSLTSLITGPTDCNGNGPDPSLNINFGSLNQDVERTISITYKMLNSWAGDNPTFRVFTTMNSVENVVGTWTFNEDVCP